MPIHTTSVHGPTSAVPHAALNAAASRDDARQPLARRWSWTGTQATALITLLSLLLIMAWDASPGDLRLAHWFGQSTGFALRDQFFLVQVMHEGGRRVGWLVVLALSLMVWWPLGFWRRLSVTERLQMAASALIALLLISALKSISNTSCPWDLAEFGGLARHISHWSWGVVDGGSGHCFPAGHASAGFVFLGCYFALRQRWPGAARYWLLGALASGLLLGWGQQMRGAHFMSHTLWTGWLCWVSGWACDGVTTWLRQRRNPATAIFLP